MNAITAQSATSNTRPNSSAKSAQKQSTSQAVEVQEFSGDKVEVHHLQADGQVVSSSDSSQQKSWLENAKTKFMASMVPENISQSVSKDYVDTRKWQLVRDFAGSAAGTASLASVLTAMVPAQMALASLAVAGLTVANLSWAKERLGQAVGFVSSNLLAKKAENNPRPWILAADAVQNLGTIVDASTVMLPPLAYYPLQIAMTAARAAAGSASNAAQAGIGPRQALQNNLGEVSVKNGNQAAVASFAGATLSVGTLAALGGAVGFGPASFAIASTGAAAGLFATYKKLQNLDYNPVNERAVRRVAESLQAQGPMVGPDQNIVGQVAQMFSPDQFVVGSPIRPLLESKEFGFLRELYQDVPYMIGIVDQKPYIVMKDDLQAKDELPSLPSGLPQTPEFAARAAQVEAAYQAVCLVKILQSPEYMADQEMLGREEAERKALRQSKEQTPKDIGRLLVDMQTQGWSVDTIRFAGESRPSVIKNVAAKA